MKKVKAKMNSTDAPKDLDGVIDNKKTFCSS